MNVFAWLGRKLFGFAASPAGADALDDLNREARDYLDQLQGESRPVPLPSAAVRHQQAQIASAAHAFPPSCPPSQAPSGPPSAPPVSMDLDRIDRYVSPPETPRPLPQPQRPFARSSSGPPPRMSPPPPLPLPPRLPRKP